MIDPTNPKEKKKRNIKKLTGGDVRASRRDSGLLSFVKHDGDGVEAR